MQGKTVYVRGDAAQSYVKNDAAQYLQIMTQRREQAIANSHKFASRGGAMFRGILDTSKIGGMTNEEIIQLFENNGYTFTNNNNHVHVKTSTDSIILRIDPPDRKTNYNHVHLYNDNEELLDKDLTIVEKDDPAGHIENKGPGGDGDNNSSGGGGSGSEVILPGTNVDKIIPGVIIPPIVDIPIIPMLPSVVFAL